MICGALRVGNGTTWIGGNCSLLTCDIREREVNKIIDYKQILTILHCGDPFDVFIEVKNILKIISPNLDLCFLEDAFVDLLRLFEGNYPGYQASKTRYHNFPHTCWVALAMSRLIHSHLLEGRTFSERAILLGVLTAFFHDTGLIQESSDKEGTGAKFTIGHEERSIKLMKTYLKSKGWKSHTLEDIGPVIRCTILAVPPGDIVFKSEEMKMMGYMLGSADLIAQMAERSYLEKLPLLFEEFKEGGVPGFESSLDLFQKTDMFYRKIVLTRLNNDMDGVASNVSKHFEKRWGIDRDLYAEAIDNQINYLNTITKDCKDNYDKLLQRLKR